MCILCTESHRSSCSRLYVHESTITPEHIQLSTCYRYSPAKLCVILPCRKKITPKKCVRSKYSSVNCSSIIHQQTKKITFNSWSHVTFMVSAILKKQYHGEERKIPWSYEHLVKHNCSWRGGGRGFRGVNSNMLYN